MKKGIKYDKKEIVWLCEEYSNIFLYLGNRLVYTGMILNNKL